MKPRKKVKDFTLEETKLLMDLSECAMFSALQGPDIALQGNIRSLQGGKHRTLRQIHEQLCLFQCKIFYFLSRFHHDRLLRRLPYPSFSSRYVILPHSLQFAGTRANIHHIEVRLIANH